MRNAERKRLVYPWRNTLKKRYYENKETCLFLKRHVFGIENSHIASQKTSKNEDWLLFWTKAHGQEIKSIKMDAMNL